MKKFYILSPILLSSSLIALPALASCSSQNEFNVTFNFGIGSVPSTTLKVKKGTKINDFPPLPTYKSHTFGGWYKDRNFTKLWTNNDVVTSNVILNAKWNIDQSKVITYQWNSELDGYDVYCQYTFDERKQITLSKLEINETYNDGVHGLKPIVRIGNFEDVNNKVGAFEGITSLAYVKIPSTVKVIGSRAFALCNGLASINSEVEGTYLIPKSVTKICYAAFYNIFYSSPISTKQIKLSLKFEDGSNVTSFGALAFSCSSFGSIVFPSSLTSIGAFCFQECAWLEDEIDLSNTKITELKWGTFDNCGGCKGFKLPSTLITIGSDCFHFDFSMKSITIPKSVKTLGNFAFSACEMESITFEEDSQLETIGNECFTSTSLKLTSLTIPKSVKSIGRSMLGTVSKESSITITFADSTSTWSIYKFIDDNKQETPVETTYLPNSTPKTTFTYFLESVEGENIIKYSWAKNS